MSRAELIKQRLAIGDLIERLGIEPDRGGYIRCPAHKDKHASLKIYTGNNQGWFCFSCRAGGSVIDFYMHYMQVDFSTAVAALAPLCGLDRDLTAREKIEIRRGWSRKNDREAARQRQDHIYKNWLELKKILECDYDPEEPLPDTLVNACQNIARIEYLAFERRE